MTRRLGIVLAVAAAVVWGVVQAAAQETAREKRQEARDRLQQAVELREKLSPNLPALPRPFGQVQTTAGALSAPKVGATKAGALGLPLPPQPLIGFNPAVDYSLPNFAYSPNIRKFMNGLPGLGYDNRNDLGQYIPIATPDTTTFPGDEYYVMAVRQSSTKMNTDLPPTLYRGYVQLNSADPTVNGVNQYMGPAIVARTFDPTKPPGINGNGKPVRVLFENQLPVGVAGNLFLPVDKMAMGAGMGPIAGQMFTENRATIPHLHGGNTPWISDGTPHQWIAPAGETMIPAGATYDVYRKGASFQNVPDMVGAGLTPGGQPMPIPAPSAGDGMGTLYWTNQQSSRLMFWHDHAWGTTRLNVYAGMAAPYILVDQPEDDMIDGTNVSGAFTTPKAVLPNQAGIGVGGVYRYGIPLVIQDKTFVNDSTTMPDASFPGTYTPTFPTAVADARGAATDPLWATYVGTGGGNMWFPHEYMPNENIYDPLGFLVMGRWDYGPFLNPAMIPLNSQLPSPSMIPEAYGDTMIVNGCAFPYITLPPTAVRFRILNACDDRFLNLQFYYADPANPTEVKMVGAVPNALYPTWPRDGRDGGVPDPTTVGPDILQIGNEGGILPQVAIVPPQPVDFDYNRRSVTFGGFGAYSLLMIPAERADIIVDFSSCPPGSTLILYNDGPAPAPLFDSRADCYTDDPDQTATGGAPSTPAGFGPNTRTVMQIRISGTPTAALDLASLQTALPEAYKVTQHPPVVPQAAYNAAFGTAYGDTYANNVTESLNLTGTTQPVAKVVTELPGSGYVTPPTVTFIGGGGSGAAATAGLNGVTAVTVTAAGTGYTSAPTVTLTGGGGTGATAVATISGGGVSAITVVNPGSGYTTNPTVGITGGGGTGATATSGVTIGGVGAITLTSGGSGYTQAPQVFLTGGGGTGAVAACLLNGALPLGMKNITEGMDMMFGRMNAMLGTTPVPLDPLAPAPQVPGIAQFIDPPSDFWNDGQTYLFRVAHLGVDSHAVHFHLANLQIVNRVDYTNTLLPPDGNELGWKETFRTLPFTDLILAVRPVSMTLPFQIPHSVRLLDPSTPLGSTANFVQPAVVPGLPNAAGISNVMTDFGWEYMWHCHLLGHEENDMMRAIVLVVPPPAAPAGLTASNGAVAPVSVNLTWTDNSNNESGFLLQRATNSAFTAGLTSFNLGANTTSYTDATVATLTRYYYRVQSWNAAGNSTWSNTVNFRTATGPAPLAPSNLTVGTIARTSVVLNWTDNATNETGFRIQRATNAAFTRGLVTANVNTPNLTTYTRTGLSRNRLYYFRVAARVGTLVGPYSNVVSATTLP